MVRVSIHTSARCQALAAIALAMVIGSQRPAVANEAATAPVREREATHDELTRTLDSCLSDSRAKWQSLNQLRAQGHASWLEVAEAQALVMAQEAELQAAREFGSFLATFRQTLTGAPQPLANDSANDSEWRSALPAITLQIARARAESPAELDAARLILRRHERYAAAVERLIDVNAASKDELTAAQYKVQAAQSLVTQLAADHARNVASYERLVESTPECTHNLHSPAPIEPELDPAAIPLMLLHRGDFVRALIEIANQRRLLSGRRGAAAAALAVATERSRRLSAASRPGASQHELESARLDVQLLDAQQLAAEQRLSLLRLQKFHLVSLALSHPNADDLTAIIRSDAPTSALPLSSQGIQTHLGAGQQSPLTAAAWQPVAPNWPINNWSATWQVVAPALPISGNAAVRYSEPSYNEFYAYGNQRLDAPSIANNFFRLGGLPWYLPGSTTNFK